MMNHPPRNSILLAGLTVLLLAGLAACVDEQTVYVEKPLWEEPPEAAAGFLGYDDAEQKLTVCGNCHAGIQSEWQETAHANAWKDLQDSGAAQSFCEACHTVSPLGNATVESNVAWAATQDPRYQDVQCESCHGPGLVHVTDPDASQPLASIAVGTELDNGCGECHSGAHHPFVEQWEESAHGAGPHTAYVANISPSCLACHEGKTALEKTFGEDANYLEKDDGELKTIVCVVCHEPHGSENHGQLRASIDIPSRENLCVKCHARSGTPWSRYGPHAAQGLLVLGENVGWIPPGFEYDTLRIITTHGSSANPRLCATCHVASRTVTDEAGEFVVQSVGHLFEAVPCLDVQGVPVGGDCEIQQRDFTGCTESGCHGSPEAARSAYLVAWQRINGLLDELWYDTDGDNVMEATDAGLLPQVIAQGKESDLDPGSSTVTVAKGAMWNAMLAWTDDRAFWSNGEVAGQHFGSHPNSGNGVHNPFLLEALLTASIDAVIDEYGVQPSPSYDPTPQLTPPPGMRATQ